MSSPFAGHSYAEPAHGGGGLPNRNRNRSVEHTQYTQDTHTRARTRPHLSRVGAWIARAAERLSGVCLKDERMTGAGRDCVERIIRLHVLG